MWPTLITVISEKNALVLGITGTDTNGHREKNSLHEEMIIYML